ncbi:MAG: GNAT family N-acetyltransferase [Stagnimonas sp.]|nr:GNAT family N-acetyltransferase [Stagnimonas sp.]
MTIRIRAATADDIDGILALEALFPSDRLTRAALRRFLRVPSARAWVAVADQAVVGDVILLLRRGASFGRVYSVVVSPEARGQGLGDRLIATAERAARAEGRHRLRLEVRADNTAARRLYDKRRYRDVAALKGYYEDGADGLRLEKTLRG